MRQSTSFPPRRKDVDAHIFEKNTTLYVLRSFFIPCLHVVCEQVDVPREHATRDKLPCYGVGMYHN